jgi:hypothetical protein
LIFDPTNFDTVNVIPNCSQIHTILAFFREAWTKVEMVICNATKAGDRAHDEQGIRESIDSFFKNNTAEKEDFLGSVFGINNSSVV